MTGTALVPAKLRELDQLGVGNLALAVGRPGRSVRASLRAIGVLGPEVRTPYGGRLDHYVESDRQIPRGFAGGALIDADGAVIGMNTRTLLRGADVAVPVVTLRRVVAELVAHGGYPARATSASARSPRRCPVTAAARSSRASMTAARPRPPASSSAT